MGSEDRCFNREVSMNIIYIEGKQVLYITDEATRVSMVYFLTSISPTSIWDAIVKCWASIYTGLTSSIVTDIGTYRTKNFINRAAMNDIKIS